MNEHQQLRTMVKWSDLCIDLQQTWLSMSVLVYQGAMAKSEEFEKLFSKAQVDAIKVASLIHSVYASEKAEAVKKSLKEAQILIFVLIQKIGEITESDK